MTTPPIVILAHDAFLQPAHYGAFTADLHVRGLTEVRIPQLPSTITSPPAPDDAFTQDAAVLHRTIQSCLRSGRDVILLAHGYGGLPLGEALDGVTTTARPENVRVLGVVWVAAVVGEEGEDARSAREGGLEGVKMEVGFPSFLLSFLPVFVCLLLVHFGWSDGAGSDVWHMCVSRGTTRFAVLATRAPPPSLPFLIPSRLSPASPTKPHFPGLL
ncbi:hypothetical protein M433DRAFT_532900 [Acidomyces richmondensis BFW]|nr:hypothetical protein M433DRAFT_532900 [Acidomyces richmondensis BFW]